VNLRLPKSPGREPVVVVAVNYQSGIAGDSRTRHEIFELFLGEDVPSDRIGKLGVPGPRDGIRDMAFIVGLCVHVHFHNLHLRVCEMVLAPIGRDQRFRMCITSHSYLLFVTIFHVLYWLPAPTRRGPRSHNYRVESVRRGGPGAGDWQAPAALSLRGSSFL